MIKLAPIEQDTRCSTVNRTVISASMPPANGNKRLRKLPTSSRRLKAAAHNCPSYQSFEATPDDDDDDLSLSPEHHHSTAPVSSKRPRLTHNKRLVANARERERVHNLTAAFEALRRVLPMYGDQEKLSRLSILRIACSYVLVLGALNELDFSQGQNAYTLNEAFHMLSYTILNELKRKKFN